MQWLAFSTDTQPFKLDIRALGTPDSRVSVEVFLRSAANQPATWNRECKIEVGVNAPSGKKDKHFVAIPPGQSSAQFTFFAQESGIFFLRAQEVNGTLLPAGNSVMVRQRRSHSGDWLNAPQQNPGYFMTVSMGSHRPSAWVAPPPVPAGSQSPELMLVNSSARDEILADGKDFARLQVYYLDPQGNGAPSDITVWLSCSKGRLNAMPLVIRAGESFAEAQLISDSPAESVVSLVNSAPSYPVEGEREKKISFGPPIYGLSTADPSPLKISLIDAQRLVVQFLDDQGRPVKTSRERPITFTSSSSALHLDPLTQIVKPNEAGTSVLMFPTWRGRADLKIWTPGYEPRQIVVEVTMWLVLVLCLGGGIVGGIASRGKLSASLLWRSFVGVLGAIVLVWFCVYAVLPQTDSLIAHSQVSVFVVSIIGGYFGTRVLDMAGKRLGYL
jgi:hypothetical protein